MADPFTMYQEQVETITEECTDPWFRKQLAACRAGDEAAYRRISERCLRLVLQITKRRWKPGTRWALLDLVQEANAEMVQTIGQFSGETAEEFLAEVAGRVEQRLARLLEQPE